MTFNGTKIALAPFSNWYTSTCSDLWSSPNFFKNSNSNLILPNNDYFKNDVNSLFAYGAKNCVVFCQFHGSLPRFSFHIQSFDSTHEKVTAISFARYLDSPRLFIGSNQGNVVIYHLEDNFFQLPGNPVDVEPSNIKTDNLIGSSDWSNCVDLYYAKDRYIVQWNIETNERRVVELTQPSEVESKITLIKVTKVDPLMMAVAFGNGNISIYGLDSLSLKDHTHLVTLIDKGADICSMAFPFENGCYKRGTFASIARDGSLRVWELDTYRLLVEENLPAKAETSRSRNFFALSFVPMKPETEKFIKKGQQPEKDSEGGEEKDDENQSEDEPTGDPINDSNREDSDIDNSVLQGASSAVKETRLKLIVSKSIGQMLMFKLTLTGAADENPLLMRPTLFKGKTHQNVIFNVSVTNPFHYTKSGPNRVIQAFWNIPIFAVSTSLDRRIISYDLAAMKGKAPAFQTLSYQVHDIQFNPSDINKLAIVGGDGLKIWNLNLDSQNKSPSSYDIISINKNTPPAKILCVSWHPFNQGSEILLAIGTEQGDFYCLNMNGGNLIWGAGTHCNLTRSRVYSLQWGPIPSHFGESLKRNWACYAVYASGCVTAYVPTDKKHFDINELSNNELKRIHHKKTECVWKDDYNYVAVGFDDGCIQICINDRFIKPIIILNMHSDLVSSIRWHPDYMEKHDERVKTNIVFKDSTKFPFWLATGSHDNSIKIIDLMPYIKQYTDNPGPPILVKECKHSLMGHTNRVIGLSWNRVVDEFLASCSIDRSVRIWHAELGLPYYNFHGHWSKVFTITWAPWDQDLIFSAGDDSTVQAWSPSEQTDDPPVSGAQSCWQPRSVRKPLPEINKAISEPIKFDNLLEPILNKEDEGLPDDDSSGEFSERPQVNDLIKTMAGASAVETESSTDSITSLTPSLVCQADSRPDTTQTSPTSQKTSSGGPSRPSSRQEMLKHRPPTKAETVYKEKKKSALPLSNITENCSTKLQTLRDVEYLMAKRYVVAETNDDTDAKERNSLFLGKEEIEELCDREIGYHKQNKNFPLVFSVSALQGNIRDSIAESARANQLNDRMVAMSASISREFWSKTVLLYAVQLEKSNEPLGSALYYSTIHRITDAVRVLTNAGLYKESLILVKSQQSFNSQLIKDILNAWAKSKKEENNFEAAAKIYVANMEPIRASECLAKRTDDPKCQRLAKTLGSVKPLQPLSENDPDPILF